MATIDEYRRNVQLRPEAQREISTSTSADTFGASVGAATERAGQSLFTAADAIDFRQQLEGDAKAREAFNSYRYAQREALSAPETGFLNQTGSNAQGIQQTAEERLTSLRTQFGDGLDPRARQKYDDMVDGLQDQAHGNLLSHTSNESRNYIVNQRQSTVEGYIEEAASNWNNQPLFDENLGLALQEQAQLAALQGWDEATTRRAAEELTSGAFRSRIVMAAEQDPEAAMDLLNNAREMLSAEDEHALDTGLEGLVREAQANRFTQGFIRRGSAARTTSANVSGGDRSNVRRDGQDRPDDGVEVAFNMGPARPNRPNQEIIDTITTAAEGTFGRGTRVIVTSGTEDDGDQHGADRHVTGMAADVAIIRPDGTRVKATDADAAQFARASAMAGALGIGFGEGYMGGEHFHIDLVMPGGGQAHTWGRQGAAMRPELTALMDRGAALVLESSPHDNSIVNRQIVSALGATEGQSIIAAVDVNPSLPADIALPPELIAANPRFEGMTVGEVYDSIATAVGDDPAARMGGNYFDAQSAYQEALGIEDPKLRAEVLSNINTMVSLQDNARTEGRREAADEAWNQYTTTGQTDFPLEMRQRMGQAGWTSFQNAVASDQQGTLTTDPDTWEILTRLASSNPKAFAELNLSSHYGKLSNGDRQRFITMQEGARAEQRGAALDVADGRNNLDFDAVYTAADTVYQALVEPKAPTQMNQEQRQRRLRFQQQLTAMAQDFYDREQREPNTREVREMATVLALPITYSQPDTGLFRGGLDGVNPNVSGSLFDAAGRATGTNYTVEVSYADIPLADRTRIASQLMQASGGELPTPDDIVEAYEQQTMLNAGLPPNVDIGAVPEWLIAIEKADNPSVTDDEIVEKYQLFLMSQ